MFAVCGRSLLLLHLLLQGVPRIGRKRTGQGKDHQDLLSLLGDCLHDTSHRHSVLYQYLVWLQELLLLDAMPSEFRWVTTYLCSNFECIGPSTVFRISLSFLALFGTMLILMLCRNRISMIIN